jgi:hypothetical protein
VAKDDVTATLVVELVADLAQRFDHFLAGHAREMTHTETSTTSSEMGGGIGSLCAFRLST